MFSPPVQEPWQMSVQAFVTELAVKALYEGIFGWLPGPRSERSVKLKSTLLMVLTPATDPEAVRVKCVSGFGFRSAPDAFALPR